MDPITHAIVGLSLAVLSGEPVSLSNPALIGCVAGAMAPDIDIVMQLKGDYYYLKNHRGISHSIPMLIFYSLIIGTALWLVFGASSPIKIMALTFAGCLSHTLLDLTNSYGAKFLWPFYNKKIAFDLLLIYDPMLLIISSLIIFPIFKEHIPSYLVAGAFLYYLGLRLYMRAKVRKILDESYGKTYNMKYMRVLPSMIGLTKWHFIIFTDKQKIIGEINIMPRKHRVIRVLDNIDFDKQSIVMNTVLGSFFKQFTPVFHIECDAESDKYVFNLIDLRYYIAEDFLHHATAVINKDFEVISSIFHPYRKTKNVEIM
ncbi:MAG: metal-dependent hydrolase [Bacillota bacterium]